MYYCLKNFGELYILPYLAGLYEKVLTLTSLTFCKQTAEERTEVKVPCLRPFLTLKHFAG